MQYPKTEVIDASNFMFVLVKFLDKHDPVTLKIIDNTIAKLASKDALVARYLPTDDGLPGQEGAFLLCSFWLVSALAIVEDVERASAIMDKIMGYIKPHCLMPEEIDRATKEYLGNYPQAFSHMGFIMSAHYIHKYSQRQA